MSIGSLTTSARNRPRRSSGSDHAIAASGVASDDAACRDCRAPLAGPYCAACGQRHVVLNPSARHLIGELWDAFGSVDGKLVRTLRLLATRPGALTVEHLSGRHVRYLSPLKLYLTVSAAYFTVALATFHLDEPRVQRTPEEMRLTAKLVANAERTASAHSRPVGVLALGAARVVADPVGAMRSTVPNMPRLMFVLVPFFALLVSGSFRRRGWRYPAHLYFTLHVFAFYFAGSLVLRALRVYGPRWSYTAGGWALGLGTLAYLGAAMRRVYGGRRTATAARVALTVLPFGFAFITAMVLEAVVTLGLR